MVTIDRLKDKVKAPSYRMNLPISNLQGTTNIIFYTYLMGTLFVPLLKCSIITIFGLTVNVIWKFVFLLLVADENMDNLVIWYLRIVLVD